VNVNVDLIATYTSNIDAANATATATDTIVEIQAIIDLANTGVSNGDVNALVDAAQAAMITLTATPNGDDSATPAVTFITTAQAAVTALPEALPQAVATPQGVAIDYKADAQLVINDMTAVASVLDATNQITKLAALQNSAFERVNADLITAYDTALDDTEITVVAIQADIDAQNLLAAQNAVTNAEGTLLVDDVTSAQALIAALPDLDPNTVKVALNDRLNVATALIAVSDSTTEAQLLTALQNEDLALTDVNADLIAEYKTLVDTPVVMAVTGDIQTNVIADGNAAGLVAALAAVPAATTESELLVALQASTLDLTDINADLIAEYQVLVGTETIATAGNIQTNVIDAANDVLAENARFEAVNAAQTVSEMKTALVNVAIAETHGYVDFSSVEKTELAELVLAALPVDGFANTTAVTDEIDTQVTVRDGLILAVNAAGPDNTATISAIDTALNGLDYAAYESLTAAQQLDVADAFLAGFVMGDVDNDPLTVDTQVDYTTITGIRAAINAAIAGL
jgi:hypothetical protein